MATGALANLKWGIETVFGTEGANIDFSFGYAVELSSLDFDNDPMARRGLGSRNLQAMGFGMFKGSMTVKFDLIEPWIFRCLTGEYSVAGTDPYQHTFAEANVLPSFTIKNFIENIDGGANTLRTFLGCVVLDWSLDVAVGNEPVSVSLNIAFANVEEATTTEAVEMPTDSPLIFANAVWKKDAVAVTLTESVSIKCNQNTDPKAYLGSRFAQRAKFGDREYDVSSLHYYQLPATYFVEFYGDSGGPAGVGPLANDYALEITPATGQTGSTYAFTFSDVYAVKVGNPQKVGEDIMEDVSFIATSLSVEAENDQATVTW